MIQWRLPGWFGVGFPLVLVCPDFFEVTAFPFPTLFTAVFGSVLMPSLCRPMNISIELESNQSYFHIKSSKETTGLELSKHSILSG